MQPRSPDGCIWEGNDKKPVELVVTTCHCLFVFYKTLTQLSQLAHWVVSKCETKCHWICFLSVAESVFSIHFHRQSGHPHVHESCDFLLACHPPFNACLHSVADSKDMKMSTPVIVQDPLQMLFVEMQPPQQCHQRVKVKHNHANRNVDCCDRWTEEMQWLCSLGQFTSVQMDILHWHKFSIKSLLHH